MSVQVQSSPIQLLNNVQVSDVDPSTGGLINQTARVDVMALVLILFMKAAMSAETTIKQLKLNMDIADWKTRCLQVGIDALQNSQTKTSDDDFNILQPIPDSALNGVSQGPNGMALNYTKPAYDDNHDKAWNDSRATMDYLKQVCGLQWEGDQVRGPNNEHAADVMTAKISAWISTLQSSISTNSNMNQRTMLDLNTSIKNYTNAFDGGSQSVETDKSSSKSIIDLIGR